MPAIIVANLAAGSYSTPYLYDVEIAQRLCVEACADEVPVFAPVFTLKSVAAGGVTGLWIATLHVEGVVSYIPCGCGSCATKVQVISQDFTLPIKASAEPTLTLTQGTTSNGILRNTCSRCSRTFVSDTGLSIAVA